MFGLRRILSQRKSIIRFFLFFAGADNYIMTWIFTSRIKNSPSSAVKKSDNFFKCEFEMESNTSIDVLSIMNGTIAKVGYTTKSVGGYSYNWYDAGKIQIPFYSVIFAFAVIGNTLVILTLVSKFCLHYQLSDILIFAKPSVPFTSNYT